MQLVPPLANVGVTVMVATTGEVVVLSATNGPILPLPFDAKPMLMVLFVHEYVVVPTVLLVAKITEVASL